MPFLGLQVFFPAIPSVLEEELHADLCDLHFENPEISREKEVF